MQSNKKNFKKFFTAENALFIRLFGGFRVLSKKIFQKKACQSDRPNSELVKEKNDENKADLSGNKKIQRIHFSVSSKK